MWLDSTEKILKGEETMMGKDQDELIVEGEEKTLGEIDCSRQEMDAN